MSETNMPQQLTEIQSAVYGVIADACRAGAESPTQRQIAKILRTAGKPGHSAVQWSLGVLERAELIRIEPSGNRTPIYVLPTGERTIRHKKALSEFHLKSIQEANIRRAAEKDGWPMPNAESMAAYDRAMKRGAPIRIVGRPDSDRPAPRAVVAPYKSTRSECGCAAEMCAL